MDIWKGKSGLNIYSVDYGFGMRYMVGYETPKIKQAFDHEEFRLVDWAVEILNSGKYSALDPVEFCVEVLG